MIQQREGVFRIYMSHLIRGPKGEAATKKDIDYNIKTHINIGTQIKAYLIDWEKMSGLPKCDLYIPAEHDEFVQIAYNKKYMNEEQILDVDCAIIDKCDLLIAYGDFRQSRGMQVEINYAENNNMQIIIDMINKKSTIRVGICSRSFR